jgi:Pyruvate/2-oxoacid:ferredoxin oxidoreductase delta subunit
MGHAAHLSHEHRLLSTRLQRGPAAMPEPADAAARAAWRDILEILFTPEEAELASRMPVVPTPLSALVARTGLNEAELTSRLDAMADKGVVMDMPGRETREPHYLLAPPVVGFFEFSMMRSKDSIPKQRMAEALHAYTIGDDTFAREMFSTSTVVGRAAVHETVISETDLPEVLDWEKASSIVGDSKRLAVSLCYCRHKAQHLGHACDNPADICLTLEGGADYVVRHDFGRSVDRVEGLELVARARELGLVHMVDNVRDRPTYLCSCCGCCCGQLSAIRRFDLPAVVPSGFEAVSVSDTCTGCGRCAKACPIGAIALRPEFHDGAPRSLLVSQVDRERCIGCGLCAGACRKDAMRMVRRAEPRHVPANAVERVVRTCLEKGRLADLLVDEGAGRGGAFLAQVLRVLSSLPVADRVLASEQVGSRFVRYALGRDVVT